MRSAPRARGERARAPPAGRPALRLPAGRFAGPGTPRRLNHLLQTFFDGSAESAVVALLQISDNTLSTSDFERLAADVRKARQEGR